MRPDIITRVESSFTQVLPDESAMMALGAALSDAFARLRAQIDEGGIAIGLSGDLGAGKTTLVRALLRRAGVAGAVKSPTYALLEPYEVSRLHFYHFDFYRFKHPQEFADGGFAEFFGPGAVCLVEWPERAGDELPQLDLQLHLQVTDQGREAYLDARTQIGAKCVEMIRTGPQG